MGLGKKGPVICSLPVELSTYISCTELTGIQLWAISYPQRPRPGNLQILPHRTAPGITRSTKVKLEMIFQWTGFTPKKILSHFSDLVNKMKWANLYCKIIWSDF